jgi:predicted small secreted protein
MTLKKPILAKAAQVLLLTAFAAGVAGCNTVQGIGKDLKDGGKAIEKAAADAR